MCDTKDTRLRCGHPFEYTIPGGWDKRDITWGISGFLVSPMARVWQYFSMWRAGRMWQIASEQKIRFNARFAPFPTPDINIGFYKGEHGDGSPFDGLGGVLAHAWLPSDFYDHLLEGDIHFDSDERWGRNHTDLLTVAAHEWGHAIGIGHSDVPGSMMFPFYTGVQHELHQDDIDAVRALYP